MLFGEMYHFFIFLLLIGLLENELTKNWVKCVGDAYRLCKFELLIVNCLKIQFL